MSMEIDTKKKGNEMNTIIDIENVQAVVLTILMGIMPLLSILFSLIGFKLNDSTVSLFGGLLLLPAIIILLSII